MNDSLHYLAGAAKQPVPLFDSVLGTEPSAECRGPVLEQVVFLTNNLIQLLEVNFSKDDTYIQSGVDFLHSYLQSIDDYKKSVQQAHSNASETTSAQSALSRLVLGLNLSQLEIQLLVLGGMAQEHEGFANLFCSLHPRQQPYPTAALLAKLVCTDQPLRESLCNCLNESVLFDLGIVEIADQAPIFTQSIMVNANTWYAINTGKSCFLQTPALNIQSCFLGLSKWLQTAIVEDAKLCISNSLESHIMIQDMDNLVSLNRALALLEETKRKSVVVQLNDQFSQQEYKQLACHCVLSAAVPILLYDSQRSTTALHLGVLNQFCPCVIICATSNINIIESGCIKLDLPVQRLEHNELLLMWQTLLPEFASDAGQLASWFPLDPYHAMQRVKSWRSLHQSTQKKHSLSDISHAFKQYSGALLPQGIKRVTPRLGWSDLVLPETKLQQLREAIGRLKLQYKVLDEWQFLQNRRGAKGVRMLFSGVPGTGKTLSAEVLANELQVDLLVVDLAAVVSKWIGETEKNLAKVFSFAEQSQAVLLFDEADAIFGRRTEVTDSHDRYANLETAYLLTRLEAYDGMTILATNFRNNIDVAFIRRLDFIVDFREPNVTDREHLWRCHVPQTAPLNADVNFTQLASLFPLVGGEIRNAAVAAAFSAAQQQQDIQQEHFIMAVRKEFEKTGKAFREVNPS
ncbi:ATP-binding protein [Aliiglaciecola lipolytica]|uniref:ATP-binding protein n=1 Tax=Aliiglaciecola lipolytica TaxID=477689 RepID=UPI001C0A00B9|nr:ATP-binding protein [Aliiglaciecola lipolytica]MBU2876690.1 ATP-binding protein [Aliiglaciecola lipolytica]